MSKYKAIHGEDASSLWQLHQTHVTSEMEAWVEFHQAGLLLFLISGVVTGSQKGNAFFFLLGTVVPPVKSSIFI